MDNNKAQKPPETNETAYFTMDSATQAEMKKKAEATNNRKANIAKWLPIIVGAAISCVGVLVVYICSFIDRIDPPNSENVYRFWIPMIVCIGIIIPYGVSLAISGGIYYLVSLYLIKNNKTNKYSHPFLWSLLLSLILFYPARELVFYVLSLFLSR